jgi:hypothetical protein
MTTSVPSMSTRSPLLRRTLQLDGALCLLGGVALAATASQVAPLIGIAAPLALGLLGVVLVVYAALLLATARQDHIARRLTIVTLTIDLLWIAGSAILVVSNVPPLTGVGWWLILGLALGVAGIAELKLWSLWQSRQTG